MKAKPRIQYNLFFVYAKKGVLESYSPNSMYGEQICISKSLYLFLMYAGISFLCVPRR